jgi:uncharacterized lipoprotein YehR (DUF1307 family)
LNPAAATAVDRQVLRALTVAAVAALAIAGCGDGSGGGLDPDDRVRDTVSDYFEAMGDGDGARVCALMTPPSREQLGGRECPEIISASAKKLDDSDRKALRDVDIDFTSVKITANRAIVQDGPDDDEPIKLQKVGGKWLVDQTE